MTADTMHRTSHIMPAQLDAMIAERKKIDAAGVEALHRLVEVAQGNSGQSLICGRLLLGCYNGQVWPFDLTKLRCLERSLFDDCLLVLHMDGCPTPGVEIHLRIEGGDDLWQEFILRFTTQSEAEQIGATFYAKWSKLYGRDQV